MKCAACSYSILTQCVFDNAKNKLDYYRGSDFMKKCFKDLKKNVTKIINCEKRK